MRRLTALFLFAPFLMARIPLCPLRPVIHEEIQWRWEVAYGAWHYGAGHRSQAQIKKECPFPAPPTRLGYYEAKAWFDSHHLTAVCDKVHPEKIGGVYRWIDDQGGAWREARLTGIAIKRVTISRTWEMVCNPEDEE